jgi:hypothetical protein
MIYNLKEEFVRGCLEDKDLLSRICGWVLPVYKINKQINKK